jgi:phytoene dehydrogenase-like protein
MVDPWKRRFARRRQQYVIRWEAILARCVTSADPTRVAVGTQSCLGLIFSISLWPWKLAATEDLADIVAGIVLGGLPGLDAGRTTH